MMKKKEDLVNNLVYYKRLNFKLKDYLIVYCIYLKFFKEIKTSKKFKI